MSCYCGGLSLTRFPCRLVVPAKVPQAGFPWPVREGKPCGAVWLALVLILLGKHQGFWKIVLHGRQIRAPRSMFTTYLKHTSNLERKNKPRSSVYLLVKKAILKGKTDVSILNSFKGYITLYNINPTKSIFIS